MTLSQSHPSSKLSAQPPLSLIPVIPPSLPLAFDLRPLSSLYISRISALPGLSTAAASRRQRSSRTSRGVWDPETGCEECAEREWTGPKGGERLDVACAYIDNCKSTQHSKSPVKQCFIPNFASIHAWSIYPEVDLCHKNSPFYNVETKLATIVKAETLITQ